MVIRGRYYKMCVGDIVAEHHKCIDACPVCFIFIVENVSRLLSGAKVELGKLDLFFEVAQIGCRLCQRLCEVWSSNDEIFQPGAEVSIKLQEDAPPGLLLAVLFEISEPFSMHWMNEGTGFYRDKKFKSWAVPFGIYTKGSESLGHFIVITPPDPSVNRQEVFDAFKYNLQACLSDHEECPKPNPNQLPTRVLRLDGDDPDRVFVHECTPGEESEYVALSYCWGKTAQIKLSKANLDEFSNKGIQISSLPMTIQDSITATQKLAIKDLWIDSLCIIQDSQEDMDKEIVNMANIYKNATITISAAAATDCGDGFLENRSQVQLRLDASMCLPFFTTADEETSQVIDWIYLNPDPYMGHKVRLFSEEAINTRAWTYQESALSPRLLIFGSGPPQWHCKRRWRISGLAIPPEVLPNPQFTSGVMKITMQDGSIVADQTLRYIERPPPPQDDIGLLHKTWFPVLENYSQRALSYETDKFTALSALAAEHQSPENGSYTAGLWSTSLPRGLLWRRSSSKKESVPAEENPATPRALHPRNWLRTRLFATSSSSTESPESSSAWPTKYIAPTWSPMSSRDPIRFEGAATRKEDEYHTSSLVHINDVHVELASTNLNPFGRLNFSYLDITGPMCCMSWQELTANFVIVANGETPLKYLDFIVPDDPAFFEDMSEKYEPSFNPQVLADTDVQHPVDDGDASIFIGDNGVVKVRMPVVKEKASLECPDAEDTGTSSAPFTSAASSGVKQAVIDALSQPETSPGTGHQASKSPEVANQEECEFWLLEVERSMAPAGLVLKRIEGDHIFARVGYFGMNRSLDPEIVCLPGGIQVRGRKGGLEGLLGRGRERGSTWNWNGSLRKRRIFLV